MKVKGHVVFSLVESLLSNMCATLACRLRSACTGAWLGDNWMGAF